MREHAAGLFWHPADAEGKPLQYDGISLLRFDEEGKISRFKAYFDSRALSMQSRPQ